MDRKDVTQDPLGARTRSATDVHHERTDGPLPILTILCHPDPERVGERVVLAALLSGSTVQLSRSEPRFAPVGGGTPRPLADLHLSRQPLALSPAGDGIAVDAGTSRTRVRVDGEELTTTRELSPEELERGVVLMLADRVALVLRRTEQSSPPSFHGGLVGESAAMVAVRRDILRLADLRFAVLLRGESGTGKELVARAIHEAGPRPGGPYVEVNVGAIPRELTASELFGTAKGAYTGAARPRRGYFQRAAGGTLFLDEIGEASHEVQVALLRVLDTGQVQRVGGERSEKIDVRVIAATDADLRAAVRSGQFRSPLLHRLSAYEIYLPPLRDRREDFGRLFFHFLRRELAEIGEADRLRTPDADARPWVPAEIVSRLALYDWPGNVRELHNVVRQLVVGNRGEAQMGWVPAVKSLLAQGPSPSAQLTAPAAPPKKRYRRPAEVNDEELLAALRAEQWNVSRAASRLGVSRTTVYKLMDECREIRKACELSRDEIDEARHRFGADVDAMAASLEVSARGLLLHLGDLGLR